MSIKVTMNPNASMFKNLKMLKKMSETDVLVGIPSANSSRKEDGQKINNAELLFVHSKGSPLRNIPARPVLEPALSEKSTRYEIIQCLKKAIEGILDGDDQAFKSNLNRAGMIGQNAARAWFTNPNNNWAPNSQATIAAKGSSNPLIDTGEMRKAITYVVRGEN